MQSSNQSTRDLSTSAKFGVARNRLRKLRQSLKTSFLKQQQQPIEIIRSPFPRDPEVWEPLTTAPSTPLEAKSHIPDFGSTMDGATDRLFRRSHQSNQQGNVAAIFVHAGAGYHSTTNEHIHLGACDRYVDRRLDNAMTLWSDYIC